jgi:hypothetical protein
MVSSAPAYLSTSADALDDDRLLGLAAASALSGR